MAKHTTSLFPKGWREGKADRVDLNPAIDYFSKQDAEQKQRKADLEAALKKAQEQSKPKTESKNVFDTVGKVTGDVAKGVGSFVGGAVKEVGKFVSDIPASIEGLAYANNQNMVLSVLNDANRKVDEDLKAGRIDISEASRVKNELAKFASDNAKKVEKGEQTVRNLTSPIRGAGSAILEFGASIPGTVTQVAGNVGKTLTPDNWKLDKTFEDWSKAGNSLNNKVAKSIDDVYQISEKDPQLLVDIGKTSGNLLSQAVTGRLLNSLAVPITKYAIETFNDTFREAKAAGKNDIEAAGLGVVNSAAQAAVERWGLDKFLNPKGTALITKVFARTATETGEEVAQQIIGNATKSSYTPNQDLLEGVGYTVLLTVLTTGLTGTVMDIAQRSEDKIDIKKAVEETNQALEEAGSNERVTEKDAKEIIDKKLKYDEVNVKIGEWKDKEGLPKEGDEIIEEINKKQIPVESGDEIIQQIKETGDDVTGNIEATGDEIIGELKKSETKITTKTTREITKSVKDVFKQAGIEATPENVATEAVMQYLSVGTGTRKNLNTKVLEPIKGTGVDELDFDEDGYITLYRNRDATPGIPNGFSLNQTEGQIPYRVKKSDILVNTNSKAIRTLLENTYKDSKLPESSLGNHLDDKLDVLDAFNSIESEVIATDGVRVDTAPQVTNTSPEKFYLSDIQKLQKKYGALDTDPDRSLAKLADKYFNELDPQTQRYLEFEARGTDFESRTTPEYRGFANADENSSGVNSVHGSQIYQLRQAVDDIETASVAPQVTKTPKPKGSVKKLGKKDTPSEGTTGYIVGQYGGNISDTFYVEEQHEGRMGTPIFESKDYNEVKSKALELSAKYNLPTNVSETVERFKPKGSVKPLSQKEQVAETIATGEKTIKQIAEETNILEPNVRRILGVGAKDGTFERVGKGVYRLSKDGQDIAYVQAGDAVDTLAVLAANDFKADMVFLDIPYDTPAVKGGNRGVKYDLLSVDRFDKLLGSIEKIVRHEDSPVIYMYSQATSGLKAMQRYTDKMFEHGLKVIGKGEYTKLQQDGLTQVRNMRGDVIKPEGILVFNMSGVLNPNIKDLNFKLVRPKGYQTEKPAEMLKAMIEMTTEEGDVVLDPFAGSGVTGAEATKLGRKSYNIEKNEDVVENITKPRIEEAAKEMPVSKEQWRKDTMERTGFTPMQMGNLEKSLNMKFRYSDTVMSRQEAIEKNVVSFEKREVPKYEYNRIKYNRMNQREQDEYDIKMKEKKTIYAGVHKDGSYIEIPKIVYDYYISKDNPLPKKAEEPISPKLEEIAKKYDNLDDFIDSQGEMTYRGDDGRELAESVETDYGDGYYFADEKDAAEAYGKPTEYVVSIKNPLIIKDRYEMNTIVDDYLDERDEHKHNFQRVREYLRDKGYDGIIVKNGGMGDEFAGVFRIAFDKSQVHLKKDLIDAYNKVHSNAVEGEVLTGKEVAKPEVNVDEKTIGTYELTPDDYQNAAYAYNWLSFNPERAGKADIESTKYVVEDIYKKLAPKAEKNGTIEEFNNYFLKFKANVKKNSDDVLSKKSRTASTAITGGSGFNVRRNEARQQYEQNALEKAMEYQKKGINILEKIANNEAKPVRVGDANAVTETNKELQDLITKRDAFKEVNARVRKGEKFSDVIKDFPDELVNGNRGIKYYYEVGHGLDYESGGAIPSFALTNLNTKIKRLESKAKVAAEVQGLEVAEDIIPGAKTIIDKTDNRLRVTHETKPDDSVISDMKSMGLHWSPYNKAWQAPVTPQLLNRINRYGVSKEKQDEFNEKYKDANKSAEKPIEKPKGSMQPLGKNKYKIRYPDKYEELPSDVQGMIPEDKKTSGKKLTPIEANYVGGHSMDWGKTQLKELVKLSSERHHDLWLQVTEGHDPNYGSAVNINTLFIEYHSQDGKINYKIPLESIGFNKDRIKDSGIKVDDYVLLSDIVKDKGQLPVIQDRSGVNYSKTSPDKYKNIVPTARSIEDLEKIADQLNKAGQANAIRRRGGAKSKKFAGVFQYGKNGNEHIKLRDSVIKDAFQYTSILTHELSHAIEYRVNGDTGHTLDLFGELTKEEKTQIVAELKAVTAELEGADKVAKEPSYYNKRTELLARYLQMRFLDNGKTMELAPLTTEKFDYVISKYQEVQDLMDAMNGIFDKGHWNGTPVWFRDLRQTFQRHLGKRAGDAAYYAELARRSQMQQWESEVAKMVKQKFKNVKDSQDDLFNAAEAILETDEDGNLVFGTKDYMTVADKNDQKKAKDLGYTFDKVGIGDDGSEIAIFSKQRYTPEEGREMFDNLSKEGQDLIRGYVARKEDADMFNRELIKEVFKIDGSIEGWVHRGIRQKPKGRMILGKNIQLRQKTAGAKKQRGQSNEYLRDFQKQTFKALIELGDAKIHNDFIMRQLARISKPIAKGQEPDEGWVEVTADFKKGLRLPGEGGRDVFRISEPDEEGFMKTKKFMTPETRYQVPIALAEHYRNMRGLPEEANHARDVMRKINKYWSVNVLLHPGTVATNFLSGGLQYSAKVCEDFYSELLTADVTLPQTRRNVAAMLQVLLPKNWQAAQSNVFGGIRSTFAGQFMEKSATDTALQKFGDYGLMPMGQVENYWKKVIMVSEQGHKMEKKDLVGILEGLTKEETDMIGHLNEKIDLYGYDYENVPGWITNWGRKGGGLVKPFIKYPYKYVKMISNLAGGAFDKTLPWNERAAKLMTLSTLTFIALMLMQHSDEEKETPDATDKTPSALDPRGRLWIGRQGVTDIFVRTAKYPFINITNAAKSAIEGSWEESSDIIVDQMGSLGPVAKTIMIGLGYTNKFEQYTPKDALIGQQIATYIPGFRILKDVGSISDPFSRNPQDMKQAIGSNLPIVGDEETLREWRGDVRTVKVPIEPETRPMNKKESYEKEIVKNRNDIMLSLLTGIYLTRINTKEAKAQAKRELRNAAEETIRTFLKVGKVKEANELAKETGFTIPDGTYDYYRRIVEKSK